MCIVGKRHTSISTVWARLENSLIPGTLGKGMADAHFGEKDQTKIRKTEK
jgi:hypothetical protein